MVVGVVVMERGRDRDRRKVTGGKRRERGSRGHVGEEENMRKGVKAVKDRGGEGAEEEKELEIAHRGGKKDGRRGGGKLQVDSLNFKAVHPAEV